ncbi:hypothetical protein Dform_00571 [Dehalogenimonas formicexedens]|uniref:Uncharacterized protein n=1 Tax=Dehalogenimonas formicexedens TaxID=1839801 RepID=A0A1P8F615_9CHLR|nr:hypothetical protein [Dehalogenimonas formicexedens]APV43926.1 hypothetical protein Dform_00571 [Dehalogenimonas formicexedens]
MPKNTESKLQYYINLAEHGTEFDIDLIMKDLDSNTTIIDSKFIDYALSLVKSAKGIEVIGEYLFKGTQIQRNYCTLFFNRRDDWPIVKKAFMMGLIDEIQAFSK